jgi:uncharacterized tellurite resistance protein B-like protein
MSSISRDELKTILAFGVHIAKLDKKFAVWERKILARFAEAMKLSEEERRTLAHQRFSLSQGLDAIGSDEARVLLVKLMCAVSFVDGSASDANMEFIERVVARLKSQVFILPREEWGRYEKEVFNTLDELRTA